MADCPGVLHLAEMDDGGLARVRVPGGRLTSDQARVVADLAERLGSGVVDLTNRANLQIRGLALDAGAALAEALGAAGLFVDGPADRRRNLLLDPLSGLDPAERMDMRPLGEALVEALTAAPWIGALSPKFSVVLDGGGRSSVAATGADITFLTGPEHDKRRSSPLSGGERSIGEAERVRGLPVCPAKAGPPHPAPRADLSPPGRGEEPRSIRIDGALAINIAGRSLGLFLPSSHAVAAVLAVAGMTADLGPDARARDLAPGAVATKLVAAGLAHVAEEAVWPSSVTPSYGVVPTADPARVAVAIPVAVGRLDPAALRWLADTAARHNEGVLVLAPWSAVVIPGVAAERAAAVLAASEQAGFPPVAVVDRLTIIACAGAPACVRAREPAKSIGLALLAAAAERPDLLPATQRSVHVSACSKGCAGTAPADLLLLGSSDDAGFALHADAAPRRPGRAVERVARVEPTDLLARLRVLA